MSFIELRTYDNYLKAHMHLQQLEAAGIRAALYDENSSVITPYLSNANGGIKLMIYQGQLERARALMLEMEEAYRKALPCPVCGEPGLDLEIDTDDASNWISKLYLKLTTGQPFRIRSVYHCKHCNWEGEELPEPTPDATI